MASRKSSKAITLKPNLDGKLVVDVGSLDIDPDCDYTFNRTTTEIFTLSKSTRAKSQAQYSDDSDSDTPVPSKSAKGKARKEKPSDLGRPRYESASKPKQITWAGSSTPDRSHSSLPSSVSSIFGSLIGKLRDRAFYEGCRSQRRIWRSLASDVQEIRDQYDSVGSLEPLLVTILTTDLQNLLDEARDLVDGYASRPELRKGAALEVYRQLERLEDKLDKVKADVERAMKNGVSGGDNLKSDDQDRKSAEEKGKGKQQNGFLGLLGF